jgi:glutamate dehydrogenase
LAEVAGPESRAAAAELEAQLVQNEVPADLAARIARLDLLKDAPLIVQTATEAGVAIVPAAAVYFEIGRRFGLDSIRTQSSSIRAGDDYDRLAIAGAEAAIDDAHRAITRAALQTGGAGPGALDAWAGARGQRVEKAAADLSRIAGARDLTVSRLTVAASRLTDLAKS